MVIELEIKGEKGQPTRTRHNCTKEGQFEYTYIAGTQGKQGSFLDRIKCNICGREWIEIRKPMKVIRKADNFVEFEC